MRISDWSSDVCSSDLQRGLDRLSLLCRATSHGEHAEVGPLANLLLPHDLDSRGGTGDQMDSDLDAALNDPAERLNRLAEPRQHGRASCRERVCEYGEVSVVAGPLKKKKVDNR